MDKVLYSGRLRSSMHRLRSIEELLRFKPPLSSSQSPSVTKISLELVSSPELRCVNLMCEQVGLGCSCRLDLVLSRFAAKPIAHCLTDLNLSHNALSVLPPSILLLPSLQTLNLASNQFTSLPAALFERKCIRSIDLRDNPLSPLLREQIIRSQSDNCCIRIS